VNNCTISNNIIASEAIIDLEIGIFEEYFNSFKSIYYKHLYVDI